MRILLDACVNSHPLWKNLRNISLKPVVLRIHGDNKKTPDRRIISYCKKENNIILTYDQDFYNIWLEQKDFNLIYIRNHKMTSLPRKTPLVEKIILTYQLIIDKQIKKIQENIINENNVNFCIRIGAFKHEKKSSGSLLKYNNSDNDFIQSSVLITKHFIS